jgi:AcrR family transcriptional regulator
MKPLNTVHRSTPARKQLLLDAALRHFAENGIEAAAVEDISRDAGMSVSAIYHHFGGKDQLAAAVYCEGIARFQDAYVHALEEQTSARKGIVAIVRFHLDWVRRHPAWARYLFATRRKVDSGCEARIDVLNREFFSRLSRWFQPRIKRGDLRRLPFETYYALLVGPCQELARGHLAGALELKEEVVNQTAQAVWRAVSRST